jgi:hypothetical protein
MRIELGPLRELAGFVSAAVVDCESGLVLGKLGGDGHTIEVAATSSTEVVRAARRMAQTIDAGEGEDLDDLLICFWQEYHIVRPIQRNPAILLYLSLDRRTANLGVARLALRQVEQAIPK